jgi:hypothetical protein
MITYLTVVCRVRVQMMQDNTPKMKFSSMGKPSLVMAFITYNGEVPISPNTMPRVTSKPAGLNLIPWLLSMCENQFSIRFTLPNGWQIWGIYVYMQRVRYKIIEYRG